MSKLKRGDVKLHYETSGSGPLIVLSHGFSATSKMWAPQLSALAERYRTVAWDLRGHGQTRSPPDPATYTPEACVDDIAALVGQVGLRDPLHVSRVDRLDGREPIL